MTMVSCNTWPSPHHHQHMVDRIAQIESACLDDVAAFKYAQNLRHQTAPMIESLVLLDRLIYLREQIDAVRFFRSLAHARARECTFAFADYEI